MSRRIVLGLLSLWLTTSCVAPNARAQDANLTATLGWALTVAARTPEPTSSSEMTTTPWSPTAASPTATSVPEVTAMFGATFEPTVVPTAGVQSLSATVNVGLLSCRYGPGPEYLYLYALRGSANIRLIGRTEGDNWHWAWVDGQNRCWVNIRYLDVSGDWRQLPIVYPGIARLPISPYYPPSAITRVTRDRNVVTVQWLEIPLRAGDEEDASMQHYIVEAWHCQGGSLLFEPLATNDTAMKIVDEPGCLQPSHARLFVQEKHGFSGPTWIPWPAQP